MEMKRYTASYINADSNFEISNLESGENTDGYYSLYCILLNLIQRGCPTKPSMRLLKNMEFECSVEKFRLFSKKVPEWGTIIKGHDETNKFPGKVFYYNIVPEEFKDYPFLQQILIPEMSISDFIDDGNVEFKNQKVDFYLGEAKLIIEIDGEQHNSRNQKLKDSKRDEYLIENGYNLVRIPSSVVYSGSKGLESYIRKINGYINQNKEIFNEYLEYYKICTEGKRASIIFKNIAIIRFQVALLQLCINGKLSLRDKEWNIAIKNTDVAGYEITAIDDIFAWLKNLCILSGIDFLEPAINIQQTSQLDSYDSNYIKIEMHVCNRRTLTSKNIKDRIYISNCWRQDVSYFEMAIAPPIDYCIDDIKTDKININESGMNSKRIALRFILENLFGFDSFRPGQERIIINVLKRNNTIGVLPTGSGKSLCYQMASLLQPCVSFCVCPIKSLMIDQDQNLKLNGISHVAYISSDLSAEERSKTQKKYVNKKYWCIFISPERFQSEEFRNYLMDMSNSKGLFFGYAVIDEVHCLSEWGHSFRVSYLNLVNTIKTYCPNAPLVGLTATASLNVLKNILVEFGMDDKKDVISTPTFTRNELNFQVIKCDSKYSSLKKILDRYIKYFPDLLLPKGEETRCGIIFTPYVNGDYGCYPLSINLSKDYRADIRAFGGTVPKWWEEGSDQWDIYKHKVQDDFKNNLFALLCATKAFGMGIDKPNVRYTIHYGIPSSLEALYQEAGRAGRDKNKAECTILYNEEVEFKNKIKEYLSIDALPSEIRVFAEEKVNFKYGEDVFRQLLLLSNELSDVNEEVYFIKNIIEKDVVPKKIVDIRAPKDGLQKLQKHIYHLSIIGVVEDWTVNWGTNSLKVYFKDYTIKSIYNTTENYIMNYDPEYSIIEDKLFIECESIEKAIINAAEIFLTWYSNNILYNRRQALLNIMEACDEFNVEKADEFKEKMEAYFRLDDISDLFGTIADQPREVKEWFEILNIEKIKKNKVGNMIMTLNRFLESRQHNVGLNFISGILNMINYHFDATNGKSRLIAAFEGISKFDNHDKEFIIKEASKLVAEMGDEELLDEFSEFFIRNYPYDDVDCIIYREIESLYSLQTFLHRMMSYMIKIKGDD